NSQLAADDLIARRRITGELDSTDEELLSFVEIHIQRHRLFLFVDIRFRDRAEVDESKFSISLAEVLKTFGNGFPVEDITVFDRELSPQILRVCNLLPIFEVDLSQPISVALLYRNENIYNLASMAEKVRE